MKRVLCAADLSDVSVDLVQYAQAIVHWHGGCLTVLHVVPASDAREMRPSEWVDPIVEQVRMAVGGAGITADRVRYEVDSGEPATAIVARALAIHADTIVLGTRARRLAEALLIGPVTEAVVRCAPCDVLTVPPYARHDGRASSIVCGVDFSTQSTARRTPRATRRRARVRR